MNWNTCRFCKGPLAPSDQLIKYGTRHYAHPKCYLDAGKSLEALPAWRLETLPYFLLKERGLLKTVETIVATRHAKRMTT